MSVAVTSISRRATREHRGDNVRLGTCHVLTPPNTTLIASLTLAGLGPAMILPGATDRLAFEVYVERGLAPALRPGHIVILDTLSAHHGAKVRRLVEAQQCELWFLPSYSPDFSPIELAFATLKHGWRKAGARTVEGVYDTISASIPTITPDDAHSFFTHCG